MADFAAPGTESYEQQQNQTPTDMSQQNNTQGPGGYQQNRQIRGNRPGDKIFSSKDEDDETKLFIGGLNWQTTKEAVETYFKQYGDLDDVIVKMDDYGKSRCFGFVKYKEPKSAKQVLSAAHHILDGKQIDCKVARRQPKPDFLKVKKLFVGGLSNSTTEDALRKYFSQMGTITNFDQPTDENKKKRGFCFITFETEDAVNKAMTSQYHYIGEEEARVEVKRAQNKGDKDQSGGYGYPQQQQQRSGQTGYWGDWSQGGYGQPGYDQNAYQQYGQYAQYPQYNQYQNQYPGYYGYPGYQDQSGYYNYNQTGGYNYNAQTGGYDYSPAAGQYNQQQYAAGNE